ncbi:MAG: YggT family protein [Bacillota bacterium]
MPSAVLLVNLVVVLAILVLVVRIVLSTVTAIAGPDRLWPVLRTVHNYLVEVTEPVLRPIRRVLPDVGVPIDLSPLIAIIVLDIVGRVLSFALLRVL